MARDIVLHLSPLHPDPEDLGVENGARIWRATSIDPAFAATAAGTIEPGWYHASVALDARSGELREPTIYVPDAAGRYSEEASVVMVREGDAYHAEFHLPHASRVLRFDPSRAPCTFACGALQVARIRGRRDPGDPSRVPGLDWLRRVGSAALGRVAEPARRQVAAARSSDRKARVLAGIRRDGVGIEIGPSHDPIAPKRDGYKVEIIDHAGRAELVAKYAAHGVAVDRIEEVDYVWKGQRYLELTGKPAHYDWIIASHLVEHTPDLVAFLADCDAILKDDGVLSLVIPDKRYCFDRFRPISGLARVIDAHVAGSTIHSEGVTAEYFMNVAAKGHRLAWDPGTDGDYQFVHSPQEALHNMRAVREQHAYLDVHNWCFVPHSFRLIAADLHTLGYTRLREVAFHTDGGYEFFVTLGRHGAGPGMPRLDMLRAIDAELAASNAAD